MAQSGTTPTHGASPAGRGIISRPALFERFERADRVVIVSAPAGSGKTVLLRSWVTEAGLADHVGWVSVQPEERDAQRFWLSVLDALRKTVPGSALVRELTAAPGLDTGEIVERLLEDLGSLEERVWLVIDDVHELRSSEALRQLELLLMRAPAALRLVLVTRHDVRLGLHRLRLEGGVSEIRARDLRFTAEQARELFDAAGVRLSDAALALLVERTEGWAAGLRLAALSLAGHPDPERFAAEFSGSERTVAEYLLAEVLERQPEEVRRLLLRTSILERVSGPLADHLTGDRSGERILHELEQANAFVVSLDLQLSWFRYHHLFADLLQLQLRHTAPEDLQALHRAAAQWHEEHSYPVEAVRHFQAAEDWDSAARVLAEHCFALRLNGQFATTHELLAAFPSAVVAADAELNAMLAADELSRGSLDEARRYLARATAGTAFVRDDRSAIFEVMLTVIRLSIARQRSDLPAVIEEAQRLLAPQCSAALGFAADLRVVALISLGVAELWSFQIREAQQHLEQAAALAHQIERPFAELSALAHLGRARSFSSLAQAVEHAKQAIDLAERHGWIEEPVTGFAWVVLANSTVWRGRLEEAEPILDRAARALRPDVEPVAALIYHDSGRGLLELARGRYAVALRSFEAAEQLADLLGPTQTPTQAWRTRIQATRAATIALAGDTGRFRRLLAEQDEQAREDVSWRLAVAWVRLVEGDPHAATVALAPVLDGATPIANPAWDGVHALLIDAIARDMRGDAKAAGTALERALDLAEPDGMLWQFLVHPAPELLESHRRGGTAHAALISEILNLLSGEQPSPALGEAEPLREPLSASETRVLRYLPTNLSLRDIGNELYVSVHTIKTHIKHLYGKLDVHTRSEAVERARALGLLAPSSRER